jgi:hypothetical protein
MDGNPTTTPLEAAEAVNRFFVDKVDALQAAKALLPRVDAPDVSEEVPDVTGDVPDKPQEVSNDPQEVGNDRRRSVTSSRRSTTEETQG